MSKQITTGMVAVLLCCVFARACPQKVLRTAWLDAEKDDTVLKAAAELNFNSVVVHWDKATTPDFVKKAKSFGLETYVWLFPLFPDGDKETYSQVMSKEENAILRREQKLSAKGELFVSDYQGGGEPLFGKQEVLIYSIPCFHNLKVVDVLKKSVKEILDNTPGLAGLSLDMFGYQNYRCCYCDTSMKVFEKYCAGFPDMSKEEAWAKFNLEMLVDFQNRICDYARSIRPDIKTTNHVWPIYTPQPLYGNRLNLDYCAQTAAWFFEPYWSDEKITEYTNEIVNNAQKYHKRPQGVPFVGYYNREGYKTKSPERLAHEIDLILSASNEKGLAIHCFGDIVKTPAALEALKKVFCKHKIIEE